MPSHQFYKVPETPSKQQQLINGLHSLMAAHDHKKVNNDQNLLALVRDEIKAAQESRDPKIKELANQAAAQFNIPIEKRFTL